MNPIRVMKFGGSSVADAERMRRVAARVIQRKRQGYRVAVVVSAPGDTTDDLIGRADDLLKPYGKSADEREMDMLLATGEQMSIALLSMAINAQGEDSMSLTGPQAGIYADSTHTKARITGIRPAKVLDAMSRGNIVIVAGFQGLNPNDDITTLGRGGSDLTAVALAAALDAQMCEIYTDVRGVYTADPRIVPSARKIPRISYDEMLELASAGAQVMQARSIECAKKYNVPVLVASSFENVPGTLILQEVSPMEDVVVSGVTFDRNQVKVSIVDVPDRPGIAAKIFGALAASHINVDMIIQSAAQDRTNDISFTIARTDHKKAATVLHRVLKSAGERSVIWDDRVAKVSIVGVGMRSHPGVAAKMFAAMAKEKVNIQMISTSEIKISCVIDESSAARAVKVLHDVFGLARGRRIRVETSRYVE